MIGILAAAACVAVGISMWLRWIVLERREVHYSGRVQGVGFRYTVRRLAGGYDVTGYVRNLPDGQVRVVVEGQSEHIRDFLQDIENAMQRYIHGTDAASLPATNEFQAFDIRF